MCHWGHLTREPLTGIIPDLCVPVLPGFGPGGSCSGGVDPEGGPGAQSPQVRQMETENLSSQHSTLSVGQGLHSSALPLAWVTGSLLLPCVWALCYCSVWSLELGVVWGELCSPASSPHPSSLSMRSSYPFPPLLIIFPF